VYDPHSIQWRLNFSFSIAALLVSIAISLIVGIIAYARIADLELAIERSSAYRLGQLLIQSYETTGDWEQSIAWIQRYNQNLPVTLNPEIHPQFQWQVNLTKALNKQHILLLDAQHRVIFDSAQELTAGTRWTMIANPVPLVLHDREVVAYLIVESDLTHHENNQQRLYYVLLLIFFLGFGMTLFINLLVSIVLTRYIVRPLNQLAQASHALANDQPALKLPVHRKDEIGTTTQAFNTMLDALAEQKKLRQQMVADIAHELRTPLSIIRLEIEAAQDDLQSPEQALTRIANELESLTQLIEDLRYLSLADAGELRLDKHPLSVEALLQQFQQRWQSVTQKHQIQLQIKMPDTPVYILADINRLQQALNNLMSNAIRHTQGHIELTVQVNTTNCQLAISDSGAGISEADLPYIFNRFYRKDKARSRQHGGSGLGLAITQQIIHLHDGKIWAENRDGGGTVFYIRLPITVIAQPS